MSLSYKVIDCKLYLVASASWSIQSDTSGVALPVFKICEDPNNYYFVLTDGEDCSAESFNIPFQAGGGGITIQYEIQVKKHVPYCAGVCQGYKLDDGSKIYVMDECRSISKRINAYVGNIPGVYYDTITSVVFDTITVNDTIIVYDTVTVFTEVAEEETLVDPIIGETFSLINYGDYLQSSKDFHECRVFDLRGRNILTVNISDRVDVSSLSNDIYLFSFQLEAGSPWIRRKILIQR